MSTAVGTHSGAGPLSLMSCVRESSPPQDIGPDFENEKNVGAKRKFWNPRKWFKRKNKVADDGVVVGDVSETGKDSLRSRSTSELSIAEEHNRRSGTPMHPGLSVSHDSVFHSPHSGSELDLQTAQSSSLSIIHPPPDFRLQTELSERLRLRRGRGDTASEDDEGLPRSPCNSPTTTEGLLEKSNSKDHPTKSHSTCSDGSLLSMGSSDMDEDSFSQQSRQSSKLSLHEKKTVEIDIDWVPGSIHLNHLNHSAAHHKNAVKPKRTHGAPKRRKIQQMTPTALPSTPEVNEELSARSLTPETANREIITELYTSSHNKTRSEIQLKCSSLPPGLAGPGGIHTPQKLSRSSSNAASKSQEHFGALEEEEDREEKTDKSFFERLFPRRSAKKKKNKEEKVTSSVSSYSSVFTSKQIEKKPAVAPRTGAAARQRVQPIDIPESPNFSSRFETENLIQPKSSPEKTLSGTSPLQAELETRFRQRQISTSPQELPIDLPPRSPKNQVSITTWSQNSRQSTDIKSASNTREARLEELRSKVKIAGLSALQQRVLLHNDETDESNGFKSLTDLPTDVLRVNKPVTKSHSFKAAKPNFESSETNRFTYTTTAITNKEQKYSEQKETHNRVEKRQSIVKAASLDSVKNLEVFLEKEKQNEDGAKVWKSEKEEKSEDVEKSSRVTVSGPDHTAVVSINSEKTHSHSESKQITKEPSGEINIKEHQVSVTKILLKEDRLTQTVVKTPVPEFFNRQLNKVENRPSSNVVFKTSTSPRIIDEETRPKTIFNFESDKNAPRKFSKENVVIDEPTKPEQETANILRKFSKEDVEIVDKDVGEEIVEVPKTALVTPRIYKKHAENVPPSSQRKSSINELKEKPVLKVKSSSLEIVGSVKKSPEIRSSQDNLDKIGDGRNTPENVISDGVVLRRKSLQKQKNDDEPELMKVFARRSLKLKDNETEELSQQVTAMVEDSLDDSQSKSRDSDKENVQDSPLEERKKSLTIKDLKNEKDSPTIETKTFSPKEVKPKEPLTETKFVETTEVTLRKPVNNKFAYQRTISVNTPKSTEVISTEIKVKKQPSFNERPKTENWLLNIKKQEADKEEDKINELITNISPKSDFINEDFPARPKNFNQKKAEWEKRAQEALKKNVP